MNPDKTTKSPEGLQRSSSQVELETSPGALKAPLTAGASLRTLEISTLTTTDVPNT